MIMKYMADRSKFGKRVKKVKNPESCWHAHLLEADVF
jgi:hypothetical protein